MPFPPLPLIRSSQQTYLSGIYLFKWAKHSSLRISMILCLVPLLSITNQEQMDLAGGLENL